jgi:hypothetical protein
VEVGDEGAHQAGLADPGGQGEAQGQEFPLKILDGGKLAADDG